MIGLIISLATVRVISHKGYLAYQLWARPIHSYSQQPRPSPRTPASRLITYTVCSAITLAKFQKPGCFRAYNPTYQVGSSPITKFQATDSSQTLGKVGLLFIVVITAAFITTSGFVHKAQFFQWCHRGARRGSTPDIMHLLHLKQRAQPRPHCPTLSG